MQCPHLFVIFSDFMQKILGAPCISEVMRNRTSSSSTTSLFSAVLRSLHGGGETDAGQWLLHPRDPQDPLRDTSLREREWERRPATLSRLLAVFLAVTAVAHAAAAATPLLTSRLGGQARRAAGWWGATESTR